MSTKRISMKVSVSLPDGSIREVEPYEEDTALNALASEVVDLRRRLDLVTGALEALESKGWLRRLEKEADHKHVAGTDPALELKRDVANARAALAAVRKPADTVFGVSVDELAKAVQKPEQTAAVRDVLAERRRQIEAEGWTPEHDDAHQSGDLSAAAACYAMNAKEPKHLAIMPRGWPWSPEFWKPSTPRRDMVKACALGLAAIESMDRMTDPHLGMRDPSDTDGGESDCRDGDGHAYADVARRAAPELYEKVSRVVIDMSGLCGGSFIGEGGDHD